MVVFDVVKDVSSLILCTKSLVFFDLLEIRCIPTEAVVGFERSPLIMNSNVVVISSMPYYLAAIILDRIYACFSAYSYTVMSSVKTKESAGVLKYWWSPGPLHRKLKIGKKMQVHILK